LLALWITGTNFSVSSGVGFLALFGVSVQTGVIMLEYINQLRVRGHADRRRRRSKARCSDCARS
jgi:cobalt-zinc-cadmium resistance protein CzcA